MASKVSIYAKNKQEEVKALKLTVSYKFVEHSNDYFFLHGLSKDYYRHLTKTLEKLQNITEEDLRKRKPIVNDLVPKPIDFNTSDSITHKSFPIGKDTDIYTYIRNLAKKEDSTVQEAYITDSINKFVKNAFELRLATNYGRIHGFLYQNIFYVVWFDPAHNLFLSQHRGKETKLELPHEVEKMRPICPTKYQEYNKNLKEIEEYIDLIVEEI